MTILASVLVRAFAPSGLPDIIAGAESPSTSVLAALSGLSFVPRFVPALEMDVPFTDHSDYLDRVEYGWPFGVWRVFDRPEANQQLGQFDLMGLLGNAIFWSYCAAVA